jgi:hypothetical protein
MCLTRETIVKRALILLSVVLSFLLVQTATADLVKNGGFETGDFTECTKSGNTGDLIVTDYGEFDPVEGQYQAVFIVSPTMGYISQTLDTNPGTSYVLSYSLALWVSRKNLDLTEFLVKWGDTTIIDEDRYPTEYYTPYQQYQHTLIASSSETILTFGFANPNGKSYIDNISVNPLPLPPAVLLLGTGLLGLGAAGWRRRRPS